MSSVEKAVVELGTEHFKEANEKVRQALNESDVVELKNVFAQRYLGSTMQTGKRLEIHGTPGNDMGCYMDGGEIEVYGNAQDQIGNTMNAGRMIIHGRCGDAAGYAMRGGEIFIRDDSGWRVGIHMKQYEDKCPTIIIGGDAGSFLGEYMAGGTILLLGNPGEYVATGMHGGIIYLKHKLSEERIADGLIQEAVDEEDVKTIERLLNSYNSYFSSELEEKVDTNPSAFYRLRPATNRPYASLYAN